jgi:acetyltransferase-like isoleucine patch superfamily enzyme
MNHLEEIEVGNNVYIACGSVITGAGRASIGDNVLIGPNVVIATSNHRFNGTHFLDGYTAGAVIIENGSWIGGNVSLLAGTHVRKSSLVGAGAVCNCDFAEQGVLIGGIPARVIGLLKISTNK